jgi:acylphosphatase
MVKRIECKISAERVSYDYLRWAQKMANRFGLTGIAFTNEDGSMGIIAEGEDEKLSRFIRRARSGHPIFHIFTTIINFSVKWHEPTNEYQNFSIPVQKD